MCDICKEALWRAASVCVFLSEIALVRTDSPQSDDSEIVETILSLKMAIDGFSTLLNILLLLTHSSSLIQIDLTLIKSSLH